RVLLVLVLCFLAGCSGPYGGAEVVPQATLRSIDPMDLTAAATTQTSTQPTTQVATTQPAEKKTLTPEEVPHMALQNKPAIKAELINPTISRTSVSEAEAQFEPLFTTDASYSVNNDPTSTTLEGSNVKNLNIRPGLQLPLQTGGTIQLALPLNR